jgi:hypothetical protein
MTGRDKRDCARRVRATVLMNLTECEIACLGRESAPSAVRIVSGKNSAAGVEKCSAVLAGPPE